MKATKRLIDSVWTLQYTMVNGYTINIVSYNRDDPEGYEKEDKLPKVRLIEKEGRVVIFVKITEDNKTTIYEVQNPQYIFSYKG